MNFRKWYAALLFSFFCPGIAVACGIPVADQADQGRFTASAERRNTAEACIDLNKFVGQTVEIDVQGPPGVRARFPGIYLSAFETNVVTIMPGGGTLIVTGPVSKLTQLDIVFRIREDTINPDVVAAEWVFRGGQGFALPQAVLTDGVREILRLSCVGGETAPDTRGAISPVSVHSDFDRHIRLGNGAALTFLSVTTEGLDGRWYGMNTLIDKRIVSPAEEQFFAANTVRFGDLEIMNSGAELAYRRLKSECSSGIAFGDHPSVDCAINARGFPQAACLNPEIGRLDREIAEMYGLLSRLTPLAELRTQWQLISTMMDATDACPQHDLACYRNALDSAHAALSNLLDTDIAEVLKDRNTTDDITVVSVADDIVDQLVHYGMARQTAQSAKLVHRNEAFSLALVTAPRSVEIVVLHTPGAPSDAMRMQIDGMAPEVLRAIAKHAVPAWVTSVEGRVRGGREVVGGKLKASHIVAGARDAAPVPEGAGFRPLTIVNLGVFGWTREDGRISAATFVEVAADATTADAVLSSERMASAAAERQRLARQESVRQERAAALAFERVAAEKATSVGYIYKAAPFWSGFQSPVTMRRIFDGAGVVSDRFILGWAAAFDEVCSDFVPADAAVFEDTTVTTWRNGYGVLRGQTTTVTQFRVDRRFEVAVASARQSPVSTNIVVNALSLGSGQSVNWDRVMNAADDVAQPYRDSLLMIAKGGCDGPITRQFLRNLLSSVGDGDTAQALPLLTQAESAEISDAPAIVME
ncbi:MAG: hypothetical protein V2I76_14745 [Roseobacter sp.]|nr:hypothetical protein [Roseobacter sp.]